MKCLDYRTRQRRHCWYDLDVLCVLDGIFIRQYFHGRDGFHVSILLIRNMWSDC
jgi:hypothetical protein